MQDGLVHRLARFVGRIRTLFQDPHALVLFGQIDQLKIGRKSLQVDVGALRVVAHLGHDLAEFTDGRRTAVTTGFGEAADLLLQI